MLAGYAKWDSAVVSFERVRRGARRFCPSVVVALEVMIVAASFVTTRFGEWRARWHGLDSTTVVTGGISPTSSISVEGAFALIDTRTAHVERSVPMHSPAGFAFVSDGLYVASMAGNRISQLDANFKVMDTFAFPQMNDLHSLVRSSRGLILTSSGTDSVLEFNSAARLVWEWRASEHGFFSSSARESRAQRPNARVMRIGTSEQATHVNSAFEANVNGHAGILATLFHQGCLIEIDRRTGTYQTLVRGLNRPHSIRRNGNSGWVLCSSADNCVILLSPEFRIYDIIEADFNWVQDALPIGKDHILIADANNSRLVLWNVRDRAVTKEVAYSSQWKVFQLELAPRAWQGAA